MLKAWKQFRHRRLQRDLSAYVDNMLSARARRRLEAHLDSCAACRQELDELRATVEALGSLPMAEVPRSFALEAAPVAEARPRPTARRLEFGLRLATATAAFALALVVIGDFAGLPGGGEEEEEMPALRAPAAAEMPGATEWVTPETAAEATPEPPALGITDVRPPEPSPEAEMFAEEGPDKEATERAQPVEEAEADAAEGQAVAAEESEGLSREDVLLWLEVGLGASVGILAVLWAFARVRRRTGNRA